VETLQPKIDKLHEQNPMLGHRGCRLAVTYPEIYDIQVEAIALAAVECLKQTIPVNPEIMIPIVMSARELKLLRPNAEKILKKVFEAEGVQIRVKIGTMIEVPRAALRSAHIAKYADFFSFGTNDLTQMTFAFSRDDVASFLPTYLEKNVLDVDPFKSIDEEGVGYLISYATQQGRTVNPALQVGICGEHGGDPLTIDFCYRAGLTYVSCSPFRVPVARLAAAQAVLNNPPAKTPAVATSKETAKKAAPKEAAPKEAAKKPAAPEKPAAPKKAQAPGLTASAPAAKKEPAKKPQAPAPAAKKPAVPEKSAPPKKAPAPAAKKEAAKKPRTSGSIAKKPQAPVPAAKKPTASKVADKKPVVKKPATTASKVAVKKGADKKPIAKKPRTSGPVVKKVADKKPVVKKAQASTSKKVVVKKTDAKKPSVNKAAVKKAVKNPSAKNPALNNLPTRKQAAKKTVAKKAPAKNAKKTPAKK